MGLRPKPHQIKNLYRSNDVSVGEGLAIAVAKAITEKRSLHSVKNQEVRQALGYVPVIYGRRTASFDSVSALEKTLKVLP